MRKIKRYTDEENQFIYQVTVGITAKETAELFYKQFGSCITAAQVKSWRVRHHVRSGLSLKGCRITNEQYELQKGSMFKKGNKPWNEIPVHSVVKKPKGYLMIKVGTEGTKDENFQLYHRFVWEKYHGMKVPDGHRVIFLDRNKRNFSRDNLVLVSNREFAQLIVREGLTDDAEINKSKLLQSKLKVKIREIEEENK